MLIVDSMIVLFHLKLDKFYCIGVINSESDLFFVYIKMNFYCFNKQELLKKAKDKYRNSGDKEKAAEYFLKTREILKEKSRNKYRNLSGVEQEEKRIWKKLIKNHERKCRLKDFQRNEILIFCMVEK